MVGIGASIAMGLGAGMGYSVLSEYTRLGILWAKWKGLPYETKAGKIAETLQGILDAEKNEVSGLSTRGMVDVIYSFIDRTLDFAWMVDESIAVQMFVQMIQQSIAYAIHSSHAGAIGTIGNVYSGSMYLSPMESQAVGQHSDFVDKEFRAFLSAEVGQNIPTLAFNLLRGANRRIDDVYRSAMRNVDSLLDEWNDLALSYYRHYHSMGRERFADAIKMKETATDRAYGLLEQVANEHLARVSEQLDTLEGAKAWFDAELLTEDELKNIAIRIDLERGASEANYDEYETDILGAIASTIEQWDAKITQALGDLTDNETKYNVLIRSMLDTILTDVVDFADTIVTACSESLEDVCAYRNVTQSVKITQYLIEDLLWKCGFEEGTLACFDGYTDATPDGYIPTVIDTWSHHSTYGCEIKKTLAYDSSLYKGISGYEELYFMGHIRIKEFSDASEFFTALMTLGDFPTETCGVGIERDVTEYGDSDPRLVGWWWDNLGGWNIIRTGIKAEIDKTYEFQIGCKRHATEGFYKFWIDGIKRGEALNVNTTGSNFDTHETGLMNYYATTGTPHIIHVDCYAINNKQIMCDPFA